MGHVGDGVQGKENRAFGAEVGVGSGGRLGKHLAQVAGISRGNSLSTWMHLDLKRVVPNGTSSNAVG